MSNFSGHWLTTFGPMNLTQHGQSVEGSYGARQEGTIRGQLDGRRLAFAYEELTTRGEGWFQLQRHGRFVGEWREEGTPQWGAWEGERGFDGVWQTSFGLMRLLHQDDRVEGCYEALGGATIAGQMEGAQLVFRYKEPATGGEGAFQLSEDQWSFDGQWRQEGREAWLPWQGRRVFPRTGLVWLVVLEAHWQRHLSDKEYSFGNMLREFFARLPQVQFSHRFFNNESGLRQWCRDLAYVPEPVVVLIASHGSPEGLAVHGETVSPLVLADCFRYADNIKLLHFSSCLMLKDGSGLDVLAELQKQARVPISGYTTSVDWAASAILEFTYLEMILGKGLPPAAAAEQIMKLLTFAGDTGPEDTAFPAAGFRLLLPQD